MSLLDGKINDHPLEITLSALEAIAPAKKHGANAFPTDGAIQIHDLPGDTDLSDDQMEKALAALHSDGFI